jgi:tetratricopeptide (TPR) repeat protein
VKGDDQEFSKLVADLLGHALSLTLLGSYLNYAHSGDIRRSDLVKLGARDAQEQGGHAFRIMEAYAQSLRNEGENGRRALALLSLLGFFDRPASADCLAALLRAPVISGVTEPLEGLSDSQRDMILGRLEAAKLISVHRDGIGTLLSLDAHPLLREYFAQHLRAEPSEAWRSGHRRIYESLVATTPDKARPHLEDLQPLYQAVAHGCEAGLQTEALRCYRNRIARREENYSSFKLGAIASDLGAIACFFDIPWLRVTSSLSDADQAWLLNNAAFCLRSLGRLDEAADPVRAGLQHYARNSAWRDAAQAASNLSELELILGRVRAAEHDAANSVTYADRSGDAFVRMGLRTTHADALHQAGRRSDAELRFREAEQIQKEMQPAYPLLYSLQGFRYCDLLLAVPERAAWQKLLSLDPQLSTLDLANTCGAVSQRASVTLKWDEEENWLLDAALDHLALARAMFFEAILGETNNPEFDGFAVARRELDVSVSGLRRAGARESIVRGLLARSWLRAVIGAQTGPESAQNDLDEAWEIAERGPMKLHMADIHLHRARLFFRQAQYAWDSPQADLADAEKLINSCGYHRRDEELTDAKQVIV